MSEAEKEIFSKGIMSEAEKEIFSKGLSIEIIRGTEAVHKCCICDPKFLDTLYETLALGSTENDNTYGIFLNSKEVPKVASLVFEIINNKCHIILLCSNPKYRIGASQSLMKLLIEKCKQHKIKCIYLDIAKESINKYAVNFYLSFGFIAKGIGRYTLELNS